jgi:hypothetical protein
LGLPKLKPEAIQKDAEQLMHIATPAVLVGMLAGLSGLYWVVRRRQEMMGKNGGSGTQGGGRHHHD